MCDCNCIETTINCECPPANPLEGAELDTVLSTTFDGAPLNIYNSGSGASTLLHTNTSSANQTILINANMYITSNSTHTLTSFFYTNSVVTPSATSGIQTYTLAPIKTTLNHLLIYTTIAPGATISIHVTSSDSTARMNWLTAFIYKYQY